MGRVAVAIGMSESGAGFMDRSTGEVLFTAKDGSETSSLGTSGAGSLLPEPDDPRQRPRTEEEAGTEADVTALPIWHQLAEPERQRFGQYFSIMVLKALGLRYSGKEFIP